MAAKRQTGGKSQLLEHAVDTLHMVGFQIYRSYGEFQKAEVVGDRYVVRNHPHPSLYCTGGKKEALVVAPPDGGFIAVDEQVRIIVEAKYQDTSGSVDEKLPYIWEAFLVSDVPNWVVILDGKYWRTARGKAAVAWLKGRAEGYGSDDREDGVFVVTDRVGFISLARKTWGAA